MKPLRFAPWLVLASLAAPALAISACGTPVVDPSKNVSGLSPAEVDAFCKETSNAMSDDDLRRVLCSLQGQMTLAFGEAKGAERIHACEKAFDECMKSKQDVSLARATCTLKQQAGSCKATVGQLKACMVDTAAETKKVAEAFTCAKAATQASLQPIPQSCVAIAETCPLVGVPNMGENVPLKSQRTD